MQAGIAMTRKKTALRNMMCERDDQDWVLRNLHRPCDNLMSVCNCHHTPRNFHAHHRCGCMLSSHVVRPVSRPVSHREPIPTA